MSRHPVTFEALDGAATAADAALTAVAVLWTSLTEDERIAWQDSRRDRIPDVVSFMPRLLAADPLTNQERRS